MDANNIKEKIKNLPLSPGVYIMRDINGDVIYVGKSKALKNRVSQYFMNLKSHTTKTDAMVSRVADFDYIMTDTEVEALILECNLIKKYRPQYNILLKDDKQYPYIKITTNEEYPRIFMTRSLKNDGAKYFGPYMSVAMVKNVIETIKKIFKVRSCSKKLPQEIGRGRPCLYYYIGQCSAPCSNKISAEEYSEAFERIADVLEGKYKDIINSLTAKMQTAAENLEFERAARYRDIIESVTALGDKQKMILTKNDNRDIIGVFNGEADGCVCIFYMRDGKIQGSEHFIIENSDIDSSTLISGFLKQYYFNATNIPKEILISADTDDIDEISKWLSDKTGYKISISVPKRGEKYKLVKMVCKNAEESLKQYYFKRNREKMEQNTILAELVKILDLPDIPYRIESYDISNISGDSSIGVCVVYNNAKASKKDYRKFNIKTVVGADDYESTREVIARRINRAYQEKEDILTGKLDKKMAKFLPLPDLILLDGGKGHVRSIKMLIDTLGEDIPIFGLVKDDKHKTKALVDETREYYIDKDSHLFMLLADIQEEVHRFAITSFRRKKENSVVSSELESIPGIGESKRKKLIQTFIDINKIKSATVEELSSVVDKKAAQNVYEHFHK